MIQIEDLTYTVNGQTVLQNINLEIPSGEFASIIGPNGAGKSTLVRIILGQIRGYQGRVRIQGEDNVLWLRHNVIGYLPQYEQFDRTFPATVLEIVLMGLVGTRGLLRGFRPADHAAAERALQQVGLAGFGSNMIGELSGGELQRVFLARALVSGSDYLFLDEPETSVDRNGVSLFYSLLEELHQAGKTILTVSHDVSRTMRTCTMLICLNRSLHCHEKPELVDAEMIKRTYGEVMRIIERK